MSDQEVLDLDQTTPQSPSEQGMEKYFFRASAADFKKIPGSPIAYWISDATRDIFSSNNTFENYATPRQGLGTTNNDLFVRFWSEINHQKIAFQCTNKMEALQSNAKWFPYSKGGGFRKWFGNDADVINWEDDGSAIKKNLIGKNPNIPRSEKHYFKEGITWGLITSAHFSARFSPQGGIFDVGGSKAFPSINQKGYFLGLLNSNLSRLLLKTLNPTLNFQVGDLKRIPALKVNLLAPTLEETTNQLVSFAKSDWDSYETSWDFTTLPLLQPEHHAPSLAQTYQNLRAHWLENTLEMQRLEEENNRIFIDAYGLQDELTPDVPLKEITLTCNPHYRYGGDKTDEELDVLLRADTVREFISYAVGCMFGRYSLDKPGLVLANQGESLEDYLAQVPEPSFMPDADNVIPLLDGDWFVDDITERFRQFLRVTFGDAHYEENLAFVEAALGKNIRRYFVQDFYKDHVQTYKRRPIYWLFSSPKGSFNALIYMHRYTPDTVSIVLNDYLREFRTKLVARKAHLESVGISADASKREKASALKEITKLDQMITEVDDYERDVLYPLATQKIAIDLDDGVKENYPKFGKALNNAPKL